MARQDRAVAYALLRVAFGVNFFCHGFFRLLSGVGAFAAGTGQHLAKSPLPAGFVVGFAHIIPWIEVLLGVSLVLGLLTRVSLICGAAFMMALTIGVSSAQDWAVAGQQLVYSIVFFLLLFALEHNGWSLDHMLGRRPV